MSVASTAVNIDWQVVGGALATLVLAFGATWQGLKKGKTKVEAHDHQPTVLGGAIMDNMSMRDLTDALKANTEALKEHTHQLERNSDFIMMVGRLPHRPD